MSDENPKHGRKTKHKTSALDPSLIELAGRVQAIIALAPLAFDVESLRILLRPPRTLRTLQEVAIVFGRSCNTVSRSWRTTGMPGAPGAFDVAEILGWHLQRESANRQTRASGRGHSDDMLRELAAIEVETARLNLEIRRNRAAQTSGFFVDARLLGTFFNTIASRARDRVMQIPQDIRPTLPNQTAGEVCARVDQICRLALTALTEDLADLSIHAKERCDEIKDQNHTASES